MKNFFETKMLWVVLASITLIVLNSIYIANNTTDLNSTIGWGWDINNLLWWIGSHYIILLIIFLVGYMVLNLKRRKTNFILSIVHTVLIIGGYFILRFPNDWIAFILFLSLIIFILNIATATSKKS